MHVQSNLCTNDHPWDPKILAIVDGRSLLRGHLCNKKFRMDLKMVVAIDRWYAIWSWPLAQVWLQLLFATF